MIIFPESVPFESAVNIALPPIEPPAIWIAPCSVSTFKSLPTFESPIKKVALLVVPVIFIFGLPVPATIFALPFISEPFTNDTWSLDFTVKLFDLKFDK